MGVDKYRVKKRRGKMEMSCSTSSVRVVECIRRDKYGRFEGEDRLCRDNQLPPPLMQSFWASGGSKEMIFRAGH